MNWTSELIVLAAVVVAYSVLKRARQISRTDALQCLKNGALLVDVRSAAEFRSGHLPNAINLPLDEIEAALPSRVKDKDQAILLHCQSGMRSGAARKRLKALGFRNAFNLGSYARAAAILRAR